MVCASQTVTSWPMFEHTDNKRYLNSKDVAIATDTDLQYFAIYTK